MRGVRFDDDVEPWRAGGDNSNAGQKVIRYGPSPFAHTEKQMSEMRMAQARAEKTSYYQKMMFAFADCTVSAEVKRKMFCDLKSPATLKFSKYGNIAYKKGVAMCFSYKLKATEWPKYLFDFKDDDVHILENIEGTKEYKLKEKFIIHTLRLSLSTGLDFETDPPREIMRMNAYTDDSYYGLASLDSASL